MKTLFLILIIAFPFSGQAEKLTTGSGSKTGLPPFSMAAPTYNIYTGKYESGKGFIWRGQKPATDKDIAVFKKWDLVVANFASVGLVTLCLNVATMVFAWFVAKVLALEERQRIAITLECGLQNGTLAIMIAATFLKNETMMLPGGVYSLLMFATGGIYLLGLRFFSKSA